MKTSEVLTEAPKIKPIIYAYIGIDPIDKRRIKNGYIKVGYTARKKADTDYENAKIRIEEQNKTVHDDFKILGTWDAYKDDGSTFTDDDIHKILENHGHMKLPDGTKNEWYKCELKDVEAAVIECKTGKDYGLYRTKSFKMRPEQEKAVDVTKAFFEKETLSKSNEVPKFLWNAKMRFGKCFTSYQLAKKMNMKRILVLTFKPAVEDSWMEDLNTHIDFDEWQFISKTASKDTIDIQYKKADKSKPIVCFGSFQDFLGLKDGNIKPKNEWVHTTNWDIVIFDEYHFGAWRDNAKHLFETEYDEDNIKEINITDEKANINFQLKASDTFDETFLPITTDRYLFLSGTPFRALNTGEFVEDQIFSWTYTDEQKKKEEMKNIPGNPYEMLPGIKLFTYQIDEITEKTAYQGEFNEFDLNLFFKAEGSGLEDNPKTKDPAHFVNENDVQHWLDIMRGNFSDMTVSSLKTDIRNVPLPYQDPLIRSHLRHTLWYLPNVTACEAMYNLLHRRQNKFYCNEDENRYVICCAGKNVGNGSKALEAIKPKMNKPFSQETITLSCGKLTTGVTVKPWTGIFMLRNIQSPETYFQAAFRVQSPWEIEDEVDENNINAKRGKIIAKTECYIFDFAINRALRQVADYSCKLQTNENSPEKKVAEFIKYLPVLAFDGTSMQEANAQDILDWTINGTTANLLARKWKDASLIHVDNDTLERLLNSEKALKAIEKIESWRNIRDDIEVLITKSKAVKTMKTKKEDLTKKEKKQLTEDEKIVRNKRKEIMDKLLHFMSRLPIFMYCTDCREQSVHDVIRTYEPDLFKLVTGLETEDYETFIELGVFDELKMNAACGTFRRYEDSSMTYCGINKHEGEEVGLFDIAISPENYKKIFGENIFWVNSDGITSVKQR